MSGAAHSYAYLGRSTVDVAARRVGLETAGGATTAGPAAHPPFFPGFRAGGPAGARGGAGRVGAPRGPRAPPGPPRAPPLRRRVVTCTGDPRRFGSSPGRWGVPPRLD